MYKKSILSVAIASSLMLTGCFENNKLDDENAGVQTMPAVTAASSRSFPVFSPAVGEFPKPNDLLLQKDNADTDKIEQSDGSFAIPGSDAEDASPPIIALENLSGASLTAPIDIEIGGPGLAANLELDAKSFIALDPSDPTTVIPNPNQNVFLIELEYASDAPLQAFTSHDIPTATNGILATKARLGDPTSGAALFSIATNPQINAKVITLTKKDGTDATYIRINPLKPLNPNKRYIAVLTDEIKDINGDALVRNPGVASYAALSDPSIPLANPALAPVRQLINDFWERTAGGYFAGLTNAARLLTSSDKAALGQDNIVFSMSFTTSNDTKVVDYMVEPNTWITDTLKSKVKVGAATAAVVGGAADYTAIKAAVDDEYNSWSAGEFNNLLAGCDSAYPDDTDANASTRSAAASLRFKCAGDNLEPYLGTLGVHFPTPTANAMEDFEFNTPRNLRSVSAAITNDIAPQVTEIVAPFRVAVNITEGKLTVPYYLQKPSARGERTGDDSELNLVNGWWKADTDIADKLDPLFRDPANPSKPAIPQASTGDGPTDYVQSNVVNAFFPFPANNLDENIPILAIYPASDANKPTGGYKTIIYQHGITTDRSAALTLGSAIVANSGGTIAVIAIDQPLHGIDVASDGDKAIWAETFLAKSGQISPDSDFVEDEDGNTPGADGEDADQPDQDKIDALVAGVFNIGALQQIQTPPAPAPACPALAGLNLTGAVPANIGIAIGKVKHGDCGVPAATIYAGAELLQNTVTNSASIIPGIARSTIGDERHFDFAGVNLKPVPMDLINGTIGSSSNAKIEQPNTGSGSLSINIGNFLTSRDNFREQIIDLMTLRLSLKNMDLDGDDIADLDGNNVHFIGHSLGTLNGIPFVEVANQTATHDDDIKTANFLTPGGNIARLAENSKAFAPSILGGLSVLADLNRGDTDLEGFLNVFQIAFDSFDPINFVGNLSSTTSTTKALFTEVVGDNTIPNSADPAVNIVQPDRLILMTLNDDDSVTTVRMDNPYAGMSFGPGTPAPLAGTDPLQTISGAEPIGGSHPLDINFLRFKASSGATHGSPIAGDPAVFGQIVESALTMVASYSEDISGNGTATVGVSNTPLIQPVSPP